MLISRQSEQASQPSPAQRRMQEWERGIDVPEERSLHGQVRHIPVTPAMQEADRRRTAPVNPDAAAWRAKLFGASR